MNTNSSTNWTVKMIVACLALATVVVLEFKASKSLVSRIDHITATRMDISQAPDKDISDLMAAAR